MHSKTKHFELDLHFVRDSIQTKQLSLSHIPRTVQIADILTKPLSRSSFNRDKLMIINNLTINLRGDVT